ncbi:hypothetical protein HKX48_001325 [Thoreauomyces humboldtii]|nr:hypothetical protein HKX48_001325 [Thoreauomyces humboldtii]
MSSHPHRIRLPPPFSSVRQYIDALISFLNAHRSLWQFHAVDFYTHDYWSSGALPWDWRVLKDDATVSLHDLLSLAAHGTTRDQEWPASLLEFVRQARGFPLPRDPEPHHGSSPSSSVPLDTKVTYGMSPKKKLEVHALAGLIDRLARDRGISRVMDLGAGQGYLDSVLGYTYQHTVLGVDDQEVQTCGARRRVDHIERMWAVGRTRDVQRGRVVHVNRRVRGDEAFEDLLVEFDEDGRSADAASIPSEKRDWLLCGLHACGDLTPNLIRHFLEGEAAVCAVVGCCYNFLTEYEPPSELDSPSPLPSAPGGTLPVPPSRALPFAVTSEPGFPMSLYVASTGTSLGFTARMLACQATVRWTQDPTSSIGAFRKHHHRALLQQVLRDKGLLAAPASSPSSAEPLTVGRLPRTASSGGFANYARAALRKLKVGEAHPVWDDGVLEAYETAYADREKEVAVVWTLRAMMAEAIESLILTDRFLSVVEASGGTDITDGDGGNGSISVSLYPLFEHVDSPRNMVIVCEKNLVPDDRSD